MAVRKTKKGAALKRWFKEDWKDVKTGKPCGRKKGEKRSTPYCRPSKRVSSKTPKTASEMTSAEKKANAKDKLKNIIKFVTGSFFKKPEEGTVRMSTVSPQSQGQSDFLFVADHTNKKIFILLKEEIRHSIYTCFNIIKIT